MELSQATISKEANGAPGGMLLNVDVTGTTKPAPAPVRNVVAGEAGSKLDSGTAEPGAPMSWAQKFGPASGVVPSTPKTGALGALLKMTVPWARMDTALMSIKAVRIIFFITLSERNLG